MLGSKHHVCESHTVLHMYTPESTPSALQQCAAPSYTLPRKPHNLIFIHISNYMYVFIYIYMSVCLCVCVVSPLPETYLFGTRPRVQAQKTFFDIRPNSTHVRPQRICLVPLLSSPVPTHAYLSIFHPSLSSFWFLRLVSLHSFKRTKGWSCSFPGVSSCQNLLGSVADVAQGGRRPSQKVRPGDCPSLQKGGLLRHGKVLLCRHTTAFTASKGIVA